MNLAKAMQRTFGGLNRILYRASGGKVGGTMKGAPILLLTTSGRKSGKPRTMPLLYLEEDGRLVVVASSGGSPGHPAWFLNLQAHPDVDVQVGSEHRRLQARRAGIDEAERLWPAILERAPAYGKYRAKTTREIPLVLLEPR